MRDEDDPWLARVQNLSYPSLSMSIRKAPLMERVYKWLGEFLLCLAEELSR